MRQHLIAMAVIVALAVGQAAGAAPPAALPDVIGHPIFDVAYNPATIRFPIMPRRIREICKDFKDPYNWVFAHVSKYGADYYIVMSWSPEQDSDSLGNAVRIFGNTCEAESVDNMFTGFVPKHGYAAVGDASPPHLPGVGAPNIKDEGLPPGNYHYEFQTAAEEEIFRDLIRDGAAQGERIMGAAKFRAQACKADKSKNDRDQIVPVYMEELRRYCRAH